MEVDFIAWLRERLPTHPYLRLGLGDDAAILKLRQRSTKITHERTTLRRKIDLTDQQVDQLVYELYDLTDEEIHIVEQATAR